MLVWTPNSSSGSSAVPAVSPVASRTSTVRLAMTSGPLRGGLDEHDRPPRAGDGALDEDQAALGVDRVDGQVLGGLPDGAHAARHAHALEDAARRGAGTDRARLAVVAVRTVGGADTGEAVPLHDARGALALGAADDVDDLTGLEHLGGDLLAGGVLRGVGGAQLDDEAPGRHARLGEVARHRLVHLAGVDRAVRDLDGVVAVGLAAADLGHHTGTGLHDGHGDEPAGAVPDLGHAELLAQHALHLSLDSHDSPIPYSLISMSTPAGRSRRMSESTVFGVGLRMSISRLCVRISKCSRPSLYLCGERITQYTFFSVGSGTGPATDAPVRTTVSTILRAEA